MTSVYSRASRRSYFCTRIRVLDHVNLHDELPKRYDQGAQKIAEGSMRIWYSNQYHQYRNRKCGSDKKDEQNATVNVKPYKTMFLNTKEWLANAVISHGPHHLTTLVDSGRRKQATQVISITVTSNHRQQLLESPFNLPPLLPDAVFQCQLRMPKLCWVGIKKVGACLD